ncbi:MAG: RNA polymerase sigma factor [Planctomycetota bacterium]|jgi:RNA polymerase sigma-70 factor (ECF subfamily)|nr:RNA polymerase sigma factor [Planctomycetota bacterium]
MTLHSEPPGEDETRFLVARAQAGDAEALEDLFNRHHDHLLLAVRLRLGTRLRSVLESADIFQSVALEAFRDLDNFEPREPGSFRHYLNTLVLNKIRDRARYFDAAKRQGGERAPQSQLAQLPASDPEEGYRDGSGRFEKLERAIQQLPEDMRQVLVLRSVDGLPSQEVARMLGKSDAAVRKAYSRAVAQLASRMGEENAQ